MNSEGIVKIIITFIVLVFFAAIVGGGLWGCPEYNVYRKELSGKARLKEAEWDRQIQIKDAQAKQNSAEMLGKAAIIKAEYKRQSDSIRAIGTANANNIIAHSLTPEYIKWLFVDQLDQTSNQIIYIPTEATIPILEAGKR